MSQLNIQVTAEFDRALKRLMKLRGITSKSEAVRIAVQEAAERASQGTKRIDFARLRGAATRGARVNPSPRFRDEDELWG